MKKDEFLVELRNKLKGLPQSDIDERVEFYSEMIDDRIEEGKTEEAAIDDLGGTDEVVKQILNETPIVSIVKEKIKPKRKVNGFEIALIIIGFPLWFPLLLVAGILLAVFYILLWVLVIVTYSIELALIASSVSGAIAFLAQIFHGEFNVAPLAISFLSLGLAALFVIVCILATKITIKITKSVLNKIKGKMVGEK